MKPFARNWLRVVKLALVAEGGFMHATIYGRGQMVSTGEGSEGSPHCRQSTVADRW